MAEHAEEQFTAAQEPMENVEPLDLGTAALEAQLAERDARINELEDSFRRTLADMQNLRKRTEKEKEDARKYANTDFASDLINVLENLDRAITSVPLDATAGNPVFKTLYEGVEMTYSELLSVFKQYGIERIYPLGDAFDHNFHQALIQTERSDVPVGTVLNVLNAGYSIKDRLIRPAMVEVAKAAAGE